MNRLEIEVVAPDEHSDDLVTTKLLIDGRDIIAEAFDAGPAEDPDRLLGSLRPGSGVNTVRLAEARCTEECCGALYVRVRRDGNTVVWDGWRNPDKPALALDTFRFDAAAYLAELRRAESERDWEWPGRVVARLLREELRGRPDILARWTSELAFVECLPWERREVRVSFFTPRLPAGPSARDALWSQYLFRLDVTEADPQEQAAEAIAGLLESDPRLRAERVGGTHQRPPEDDVL
ncbi:hypothetical protein [Actinomadura chibensis]|uniref:Uncharacterized protein n=1 Tax=Actinomadura chibensis TaxID=392828 RepID=A0A5D0N2Y4_9ACTN|nr:hypothetical protein [Actinomadura chibensis]TYB38787.1 hypothetical protein FXF69_40605 [Actinomadura chibensis]